MDGAGVRAGAGRVWRRSVLGTWMWDVGAARQPGVSVAEGPWSQSRVALRCFRRGASSWLCLPPPAPGCAFPTQRRQLWFCVSPAAVLRVARGAPDPNPCCRDSLGVSPARTQMWRQTLAQGQRCSVTPGRPSWRLGLHREAVALPAWNFLEGLQTQDRGSQAARWKPPNPEAGKPSWCVGLRG